MIQYGSTSLSLTNNATVNVGGYPDTQAIVIYNESPYYLNITLTGSGIMSLPAYTADVTQVFSGFTGNIVINSVSYLSNTDNSSPSFVAFVQTYGNNDLLAQNIKNGVGTGYPIPLVRQVTSDVSNATSVTNTGYAQGTIFVSGTPVGDTVAATILENNGTMILGSTQENSSVTLQGKDLFSVELSQDGISVLDTANHVRGSITASGIQTLNSAGTVETNIDTAGNATFNTSVTCPLLEISGNNLILNTDNLHAIILQNNGNSMLLIEGSGPVLGAGTLSFLTGSLSRISKFTASVTTTSTFFNHGLGAIPDIILAIPDGSAATSTRTFEYDSSTMTSTQVKLTGGSSFNLQCLAIKF